MPDINRKTIRRATTIYWLMLIYIIAALAWWFISLQTQLSPQACVEDILIRPQLGDL